MKVSFIFFAFALFAYAEITNEEQYYKAFTTPDGLNYCLGSNLKKGHDAEFKRCVRTYFPKCSNFSNNIDTFNCMFKSKPVNVSQKDRQRHKQIEEWQKKHK